MVLSRRNRRKASHELKRISCGAEGLSEYSNPSSANVDVSASTVGTDACSTGSVIQSSEADSHQPNHAPSDTAKFSNEQPKTPTKTDAPSQDNAATAYQDGPYQKDTNGRFSAPSPESLTEPVLNNGNAIDNLGGTWDRPLTANSDHADAPAVAKSPRAVAGTDAADFNHRFSIVEAKSNERLLNVGRPAPALDQSRPLYGKSLNTQPDEMKAVWSSHEVLQWLPPWSNLALDSHNKTLQFDLNEFPELASAATRVEHDQPNTQPQATIDKSPERGPHDDTSKGFGYAVARTTYPPGLVVIRHYEPSHRVIRSSCGNSTSKDQDLRTRVSPSDTSVSDTTRVASREPSPTVTLVGSPQSFDALPNEDDGRPLPVTDASRRMVDPQGSDSSHHSWTHHAWPQTPTPVVSNKSMFPWGCDTYEKQEARNNNLAVQRNLTGLQPNPLRTVPSCPRSVPQRYEVASYGTASERCVKMQRPDWTQDARNRMEPSKWFPRPVSVSQPKARIHGFRRALATLACPHGCSLDDVTNLHLVQSPAMDLNLMGRHIRKSREKSAFGPESLF
ncbi:MAG: hypothetical protein Q9218_000455 [Villophora microphyllina]